MKHASVLMLATFILAWMSGVSEAQPDTLRVPSDLYDEISEAVSTAQSGDLVLVSDKPGGNAAYEPFIMASGVKVEAAEGQDPWIDGSYTATVTVDWPTTASNTTILDGFRIVGGTLYSARVRDEGIIRNCAVENATYARTGIGSYDNATIANCDVTVGGYNLDRTGIEHTGGPPHITGCNVDVTATGTGEKIGILIDCSSPTTGGEVSNCRITMDSGDGFYGKTGSFLVSGLWIETSGEYSNGLHCGYDLGEMRSTVRDCFVLSPGGTGVWVADDSVKVSNVTVDNVQSGIASATQGVVVSNCIVTNWDPNYHAFYNVDAVNCIADGSNPYGPNSQGTGSVVEDPLYCDASNDEYTLRVDSWGNPEINQVALVGAFPIACMFGTLQHDAVYTAGGTLAFTGDAVVPDAGSLFLGAGTALDIATSDGESGGADLQKVELIVEDGGSLTLQGASGNPIHFRSVGATEGDWYGVRVKKGGVASVEYADFQHATLAAVYQSGETGSISHCTFSNNEDRDIIVGVDQHDMDLSIDHNTLTVGGGSGIELEVNVTGVTVDTNVLTGTSSSFAGIFGGDYTNNETPLYTGNTISGFTTGGGIRDWNSNATMTRNTITNCNWGIQLRYGSPTIGMATDSSSDNIIQNNGTGVMCDSTAAPTIRNNQINSNGYGVVAQHVAAPNLGTHNSYGKNTLTGNTYNCILNRNTSGTLNAQGNFFGEFAGCPPPGCTSGNVDFSNWLCTQPAGFEMAKVLAEPRGFRLLGAGPNPMAATGTVYFALEDGQARVHGEVFDLSGRVVRDLGEIEVGPGTHVLAWDGRSDVGTPVRSGLYFIRLEATNGFQGTTKLLVAR